MACRCHMPWPLLLNTPELNIGRGSAVHSAEPARCPSTAEENAGLEQIEVQSPLAAMRMRAPPPVAAAAEHIRQAHRPSCVPNGHAARVACYGSPCQEERSTFSQCLLPCAYGRQPPPPPSPLKTSDRLTGPSCTPLGQAFCGACWLPGHTGVKPADPRPEPCQTGPAAGRAPGAC